ncbi:MAG: hypothetical protein KDA52_09575 [Planctomycetaceae bacterium]|nr:hypothetical protein [Planctomycetaceae bacterium]
MAENSSDKQLAHQRAMLWWIVAATCVVECLLWAGSCFILYWFVPTSVEKLRGAGIEPPRSMLHVIDMSDYAVNYWWFSIPFLLVLIVLPKVAVLSRRHMEPMLFLLVIAGAFLPVAVGLCGTALTKLFEAGLIP